MARTITVAAAQTGPVLSEDLRPGLEAACRLVEQAAEQGAEVVCFSELFLTPFFPNSLRQDYEHLFLALPSPITDPLFALAREKRVALVFPYGERDGSYFYNAARVALSEQSYELASLRVMGFTRAEISVLLLSELAVLTVLALPLGSVLGYGLALLIVQTLQTEVYRFPLAVSRASFAWGWLGVIAAAVASALIVRRRLDRLDLIAVLKVRE